MLCLLWCIVVYVGDSLNHSGLYPTYIIVSSIKELWVHLDHQWGKFCIWRLDIFHLLSPWCITCNISSRKMEAWYLLMIQIYLGFPHWIITKSLITMKKSTSLICLLIIWCHIYLTYTNKINPVIGFWGINAGIFPWSNC